MNGKSLKSSNTIPIILTVARLTKQKAIDRLVRVHKRLIEDDIKHKVYVIGDGEEREDLQNLIKKLQVVDTFILLGAKSNPYPYFKECDIFTLLSYYEGYGMVLEEAKTFEKPIVITNTAAKEAIEGYKNSLISDNDENSIYLALKMAINNI